MCALGLSLLLRVVSKRIDPGKDDCRLHLLLCLAWRDCCRSGCCTAALFVRTRTRPQGVGSGCRREGGAITIRTGQGTASGVHRLSKNHTIACAKRVLVAHRRPASIASNDKPSKDGIASRIARDVATLRWRHCPKARCGQLLINSELGGVEFVKWFNLLL